MTTVKVYGREFTLYWAKLHWGITVGQALDWVLLSRLLYWPFKHGWYYPSSLLGKLNSTSFSTPKAAHEHKCKAGIQTQVVLIPSPMLKFMAPFLADPDYCPVTIFTKYWAPWDESFLGHGLPCWGFCRRQFLMGSFLWFLSSLQRKGWEVDNIGCNKSIYWTLVTSSIYLKCILP